MAKGAQTGLAGLIVLDMGFVSVPLTELILII